MTISTTSPYAGPYAGDGSTLTLAVTFPFRDAPDLLVVVTDGDGNETTLALDTDYTVTQNISDLTGSITLTTAVATGSSLIIARNMPYTQTTSVRNQGTFLPHIHEDEFDNLVMMIQQLAGLTGGVNGLFGRFMTKSLFGDHWKGQGIRIQDIADPIKDQDAATKHYVDAGDATLQSEIDALQIGQESGIIGFETKDAMTSDTTSPVGTLAIVTNDSDYDNNTTYRWNGTQWVPIVDRLKVALGATNGFFAGTDLTPATGAYTRTFLQKSRDIVSIWDFRDPSDASDDYDWSVALNAACAFSSRVFLPPGTFKISKPVTIPESCALIGSGRTSTTLTIGSDFSVGSSSGVINLSAFSEIRGIGITFDQSAATSRATLVQYPPAIYAVDCQRFIIDELWIGGAYDGIVATGNSGGSLIGFVEIGAFNQGIVIGGSKDFFHGYHWHFWPFGISNSDTLLELYQDGNTVACVIGSIDGLVIDSISSFQAQIKITSDSPVDVGIPMLIGMIQLDTDYSRLLVQGGVTHVGSLYGTKSDVATREAIAVTSGKLTVGYFRGATSSSEGSYLVRTTGSDAILHILSGDVTNPYVFAQCVDGLMTIESVRFNTPPLAAFEGGMCQQAGGAMQIINCTWLQSPSTTSNIYVALFETNNEANRFEGNNLNGWAVTYTHSGIPIYPLLGDNSPGSNPASILLGAVNHLRVTGTASSSGTANLSVDTTSLENKIVHSSAYYISSSGVIAPCSITSISDSSVAIAGAAASASVWVVLSYLTN